ncbi:MAG: hypothetical protein ACXAC2_01775 [Candidatus Kariarchaeaceae archaeon]|jgi:hypothetical protein
MALFVIMPVTYSLSVPVNQDIILKFGDSVEELAAIETLQEYNEFTKTLDVDNKFAQMELMRSFGKVFVVGHGNDEGIVRSNGLMKYEEVNSILTRSSGSAFVYVACNSANAAKSLNRLNTFGFPGLIEPVTGALIASHITGSESATVPKILSRMINVANNPSEYSTLYFGPNEMVGHVSALLFTIALTILTATAAVSQNLLKHAVIKYVEQLSYYAFTALAAAVVGTFVSAFVNNDFNAMFGAIYRIFKALAAILLIVISSAPWWLLIAVYAAVAADSIINTFGTALKVILLLGISATLLLYQFYKLDRDKRDRDDYYFYSAYW